MLYVLDPKVDLACHVISRTSPYGQFQNTDTSILQTVRLVPEKLKFIYNIYLCNREASVIRYRVVKSMSKPYESCTVPKVYKQFKVIPSIALRIPSAHNFMRD